MQHRLSSKRRQAGFVVNAEVMLIATILVIGTIVGMQAVRTAAITELADFGEAIGAISQTFSYTGAAGHHASSNGSAWADARDTCDTIDVFQTQPNSRCLVLCDDGGLLGIQPLDGENDLPPFFSTP